MLLDFSTLIKKYNCKVKGVVQIGASIGQEVPIFQEHSIENICLIEPQGKAYNVLLLNYADKNIELINAACGSHEGYIMMNIAPINHGMSSSLLKPKLHLQQHPEVVFSDVEEVRVMRLDEMSIDWDKYNMIVADVQGFEGEVFKGAKNILKHVDYIMTEINTDYTYEDNMLVDELDELLGDFKRVETSMWPNTTWGDSFFVRKTLL